MDDLKILKGKVIDPSTILGIVFAFLLIGYAIKLGGNWQGFVDLKSFLIVVLGTFMVTIACFSFKEIGSIPSIIIGTVFYKAENIKDASVRAVEISKIAKKEGFLALDKREEFINHNQFFQDGVRMLVDGVEDEQIEKTLNNEIEAKAYRHKKSISILRKAAEVSPSMGLIGTLIGLVQMLGSLEDTSVIGPAMAVALLTTFYGAVLSYMVFSPIASKLERNIGDELLVVNIYFQAIRSMSNKEEPRKLERIINGMLPTANRMGSE